MTSSLPEQIAGLRDAAETAALRLSGDDTESDLEELAGSLAALADSCRDLAKTARGSWKARLTEAGKHIQEARDLLDDGEPTDAVALEVMAAREGLRR